jgi:lysophospholipase L1-like esterase
MEGGKEVEMINGGVAGWVSDQIALWAEKKVSAYQPDIVVLYVGWNDFQTYDPLGPPPTDSFFDQHYGSARLFVQSAPLKLLAFASAAYGYYSRKAELRGQRRAAKAGKISSTQSEPLQFRTTPAENYRFYLRNLDRIISAFQNQGSTVQLAICTVAGRWPDGTEAEFNSDLGATWWMKQHRLGPIQAAATLDRFNDMIRDYAKTRGLVLIDVAKSFADLDRSKLQTDFAHLTPEGYELLAEVIYDGLRRAAIVNGAPSTRLNELRTKYHVERKLPEIARIMETR